MADMCLLRLNADSPVSSSSPVTLPAASTLKILLTAKEGKTGKRPHQAFLTLQDPDTGLEESLAFSVKDNGKATVAVVRQQPSIKAPRLTSTLRCKDASG